MDEWPPDLLPEPLADLLHRSTRALSDALGRLIDIQRELQPVVEVLLERPWSEEEYGRYASLTREQRKAHRHYLATRDWFDGVRRRIRQRAARLEQGA